MLSRVRLTDRELAHHGVMFGAPGSGKTTALELLIEAAAGRLPVVIVDPKGSPALVDCVSAHGGTVWTIDGTLPADLLDSRPWQVPDLLLEAEDYSPEARAFRDAAHQRALWAAWALALQGELMQLARLRALLDRSALIVALEPLQYRDERIARWLDQLRRRDPIDDAGARDLDRALGSLLDGPALRGSLSGGPGALRLDDVLQTRGLVLFSLDAADYPHATRKVAAWLLLAMSRLAGTLPGPSPKRFASVGPVHLERPSGDGARALLLVDEVGALGSSARHLRGLVGRAREAGLSVVLATQGPSDLVAIDRVLLPQVLQDTGWQLAFRQGSPEDAERMQALFGTRWVADIAYSDRGYSTTRTVERPNVPLGEWMNGMQPGDAWLRVAPIDGRGRQQRIRVALPRKHRSETVWETPSDTKGAQFGPTVFPSASASLTAGPPRAPLPPGERGLPHEERRRPLPSPPPTCPPELLKRMGADVSSQVVERWESEQRNVGACLVWTGVQIQGRPYGRLYDTELKRSDEAHRVVWRRVYGAIRDGLTVDHVCGVTLCQRPDHLELVTKAENTRRRHARPHVAPSTSDATRTAQRFVVALFAGIDRPRLDQRTLALDELVGVLTRFEVLVDKRAGRCWSPTEYAPGLTSRGNVGVAAVSVLVFDLDRVPPAPERLGDVCWIAHTTWSHRADSPRWRLAIPLAAPVAASRWRDVWLRARAALCPEADPSCKDASRQYYLPAHAPGAPHEATYHRGAPLDVRTLPALAPQSRPPRVAKARAVNGRRGASYMATVIASLATAVPGGRNAALNRAAWTLGRWIAAGALEQTDVEDALYRAAEVNGLVADDGERQTWATIRSGLSAGLNDSADLSGGAHSARTRA